MGGDGVYYSDANGESGWSLPVKTQVLMSPAPGMP
jgi:pseudouridine kinase